MGAQTPATNRRVLCIDDEPKLRCAYERTLTTGSAGDSSSFEVSVAAEGREGVRQIAAAAGAGRPFAVAFIDRRFPSGWDGVETAFRAWGADPDLEIVLCTAYTDGLGTELAARGGTADRLLILKKPFTPIETRQLAATLSEKWRLRQQSRARIETLEAGVVQRAQELEAAHRELLGEAAARRRMEADLLQAHKLEAVGQLAAGIAHEINTPTQYIGDNVSFLKVAFERLIGLNTRYRDLLAAAREVGPTGDPAREADRAARRARLSFLEEQIPRAISQSLEGVERVSGIVSAMREFSHPGGAEKTAVDVHGALRNTVTVARNEWKYVSDVVFDLDEALPSVPGLPGELNQVFLNLIVNAAHAIGERVGDGSSGKGTIAIATSRVGGFVEVRISDTGCGIPETARGRIFEPFFTTKEVGRGSGQGLAIARSVVVDKHGGTLTFTTRSGEGTTFFVRLPLADPGEGEEGRTR